SAGGDAQAAIGALAVIGRGRARAGRGPAGARLTPGRRGGTLTVQGGKRSLQRGRAAVSVYYRCAACGGEHPSPVSYAEKLYFDSPATLDLNFECPATGRES